MSENTSALDEKGREIFDQTPIAYPIKFDRPTPLNLRIRQQILSVMQDMSLQDEYETPEEADDFELDDGQEFNSQYEIDFDHIGSQKLSALSKEESAPGGSSDGKAQAEPKGEASPDE